MLYCKSKETCIWFDLYICIVLKGIEHIRAAQITSHCVLFFFWYKTTRCHYISMNLSNFCVIKGWSLLWFNTQGTTQVFIQMCARGRGWITPSGKRQSVKIALCFPWLFVSLISQKAIPADLKLPVDSPKYLYSVCLHDPLFSHILTHSKFVDCPVLSFN